MTTTLRRHLVSLRAVGALALGLALALSLAPAPRAFAAADDGPPPEETTGGDCVEGIEGGNETICVSGEAPGDPCEGAFGAGWQLQIDPLGNAEGCACTDPFFCEGGGGGGGGGGGTPPPPGGGGGGDDGEDESDKLEELQQCFGGCVNDYNQGWSECAELGVTPTNPDVCAVPSVRNPGQCAGTNEICHEMNVLPNGQPAVPDDCLGDLGLLNDECRLLFTQCMFAWNSYEPPDGRQSIGDVCEVAGNRAYGQCQKQCVAEVYEGSGCTATSPGADPIEGTLQITGQCCNAEFDCASCTNGSPGSQCTIEDGPTQRTDPIRGGAGVLDNLNGVLVEDVQQTTPTFPVRPILGTIVGTTLVATLQQTPPPAPTPAPEVKLLLVSELLTSAPLLSGPPPGLGEPPSGEDPAGEPSAPSGVTAPEPALDPLAENGGDAAGVVELEGVQKTRVARLGAFERPAALRVRLGEDGSFRGLDELGQLYEGDWGARSAQGSKLAVALDAGADDALARLLRAQLADTDAAAETLALTGPPRIELRTGKGGALVGRIRLAFEVEVDGVARRGRYTAKLHEAVVE